ncbi:hypothetical protein [Serratia fonticola]|jgi:hypothetical protein|uniref:Uncharacterized protein n=1 Tax=Serratia fonticola TaxID=47917 RepID=A0A3S4X3G8_SERFO|nr:hypothetical protein [Serratia fonticola]MBL5826354.1 hypothetical protein [Serratia fonticola]MBL5903511.1 hypothetical protein [Serratia fonticola]NTY88570.1 hypothetical protein [Serratia fonticola]NTZ14081.1 hypothetical protein [Serratia fonticola]CAI0805911.1 Uncharacterised protein [Serratia fonticola]
MKVIRSLIKATTALSLLAISITSAYADVIPLAGEVQTDQFAAKVVSVDQQNRVVVLAGAEGHNVSFKLTDQAKDLTHLKAGDTIQATIVRSRIVKLDTDLDKAAPAITSLYEESNATKNNPNPNVNAVHQVNLTLKITHIDVKKHEITFEGPAGRQKVVSVEDPAIQARLKDLKVNQSVVVTYTDLLDIRADHTKKSD